MNPSMYLKGLRKARPFPVQFHDSFCLFIFLLLLLWCVHEAGAADMLSALTLVTFQLGQAQRNDTAQ